jgi:hypothetical protein
VILLGVAAVIGVSALVGWDDETDETVPAADWAGDVCESVGVWRGELEAIADQFRTPGQNRADLTREDDRGAVRVALERAVAATDALVQGIESAGIPDTPEGDLAAQEIEDWAQGAQDDLENELESLEDAGEEPAARLRAVGRATGTLVETLVVGLQTLANVVQQDPQLGVALVQAESCRGVVREGS